MELVKVGSKTYYIKNATNIGVYVIDDNQVYLIDTGNDKEAGKKILKIIEENGWQVKGIIATHSNSDHVGGNKLIQERTDAKVLAWGIEKSITEHPLLEPSFLYGSYPFKELQNKFLMAKPSKVESIENNLPDGLEYFSLKGHFFDMIGIKTSDDVYFLGDALFSLETINKYQIFFIYNVKEYLETLDFLEILKGNLFVIAHGEAYQNINELIKVNREKIREITKKIYDCCLENSFEEIEEKIFNDYNLEMNLNQYFLVGSTIKAYLTYLKDNAKISYEFKDNKMIWKQREEE